MKSYVSLPLENIYRVVGSDFLQIDGVLNEFKHFCGEDYIELNQTIFDDENFSVDDIINACNQVPFLAEKRLVILKDVNKVTEIDKQKLFDYSKNPNKDCILVVIDNNKNFSTIKSKLIECKPLNFSDLSKIITDYLSGLNIKIENSAIKLLVENCSFNISKLMTELKKLSDYVGENGNIDANDVINLVTKNDDYSVFELSDALSKKQSSRAVKTLKLMLENSEPLMIVSLLAGHFRRLFFAKISTESSLEISKILGVKEYSIIKAREQAENFTAKNLKKIMELILDTEYLIKSGQMNAVNGVHFLIFSILEIK